MSDQQSKWGPDDRVWFSGFDVDGTVLSVNWSQKDGEYVYFVRLDDSPAIPIHIPESQLEEAA